MSPDTCAAILEKAGLDNWALGKTKVMSSCNFPEKKINNSVGFTENCNVLQCLKILWLFSVTESVA